MITQENIPYTADEIKAMVKTCEKYNKALERAQKMQENSNGMILKKWLWGVFPEVKESEDERIRKEIIRILKGETGYTSKEDTDKYVAWLEKQGEQKYLIAEIKDRKALLGAEKEKAVSSTDKLSFGARIAMLDELLAWVKKQGEKKPTDEVEPKFKVGDWVLNNVCFPVQIASIKDGMYIFTEGDAMSVSFVDENYHLWSIQDAMDGDVLDCEGCEYLLFKSFSNTDGRIKLYCWYNVQTNNFHGRGTDSKLRQEANIRPATKEQRDLLFQKMKEAGYEWDAEKKELKKFNVGDWITDGHLTCKVLGVTGKSYELHPHNDDYCHFETDIQSVDKYYRLWTIQDAKDGDVLNTIGGPFIYKKHDKDYVYCYCGVKNLGGEFIEVNGFDTWDINNKVYPATKEQRDLLFQKMKEAGYEWDANKKELKKIGPKKLDANKVINWVNPDRVIEWLKDTINETTTNYGVYKETHLTLPYNSIEGFINDFKEKFGL